jgi:sarcosine oxidase subunit alpha
VGWTAPTSLLNQSGDVPVYDRRAARFRPDPERMPANVLAAGGIVGDADVDGLVEHGDAVGREAARRAHAGRGSVPIAVPELPVTEHPELFSAGTGGFVDLSEDVSAKDLLTAVAEGYDSVELVKRYTTATMGPAQGKLETVNTVAIVAAATGRTIAETGTTTWRPMYAPVTLGALAGRPREPVRYSPMQPWHERHGAVPLVAGQWIRPDHYGDPAAEVTAVRTAVGLIDVTPIGKLDLRGPDVPKLLELLYVNKWQKLGVGRVRYGLMCAEDGVVLDDGVTGRLGENHYLMSTTSSGAAPVWEWVERWLQTAHPEWRVHVTPVTTAYASINVAGPRSRELLQALTDTDLSNKSFPWLTGKFINVGIAQAHALRVNFVGELGWELHHPIEMQNTIFDLVMDAGREFDIRPFGIRAMDSLRLEKSYRLIPRELSIEYAALESGLDRFVHLNKGQFIGRDALVEWQQRGFRNRFVTMEVHGIGNADARGSEPIYKNGELVGRCTSGGFGWRQGKSLALGMVRPDLGELGSELEIKILGERHRATVIPESPFDPENKRLRA